MKVSIIVSTYNGSSRILNVLCALKNQTVKDFEVIVAIDGSTDNTRELLQEQTFSFKDFKIIEQTNRGRAAIRNYGASAATGELLIFYDDDMRPTEISVEKHLVFHKDHPNCIYGGNQLEENVRCKTDVQKFKRHLSLKWTAKYHEGLNELSKENLFLTAANFSIPKSLFEKLGGFDERLKDAEDFELGIRALDHGYNVYFDKSNIAWHDDFVTCRSYVNRQRQYQKANDVLSKRLPNEFLRKPLYFHHMNWMKRFIFYMFSNSVFVKMIDKEDFLFLPKRIRFKIYDLTVTGLGRIYTNKPLD